jgi:hypothetical protein
MYRVSEENGLCTCRMDITCSGPGPVACLGVNNVFFGEFSACISHVSEVRTASIIRFIIRYAKRLHCPIFHKALIFIVATVTTGTLIVLIVN